MTHPIGHHPTPITSLRAGRPATPRPAVAFGGEEAFITCYRATPPRTVGQKITDGLIHAFRPRVMLDVIDYFVDGLALGGALFTGGLSLLLMGPGLCFKGYKFYQGFRHGRYGRLDD